MAKKQRKYNCPPRSQFFRCCVCYTTVSESSFYNHIATACGGGKNKKDK